LLLYLVGQGVDLEPIQSATWNMNSALSRRKQQRSELACRRSSVPIPAVALAILTWHLWFYLASPGMIIVASLHHDSSFQISFNLSANPSSGIHNLYTWSAKTLKTRGTVTWHISQ
jgi:hypothetical protein